MKNIHLPVMIIATCLLGACTGRNNDTSTTQTAETIKDLPAGTVIAADSMPIVEDQLNNFIFSIKISTTPKTSKGHYAMDAEWGYNIATSEFVMPKNDYPLIPVLKRTGEPYTFIVGFYAKGDTTFYDYYEVHGERGQISMRYTKGYNFQ